MKKTVFYYAKTTDGNKEGVTYGIFSSDEVNWEDFLQSLHGHIINIKREKGELVTVNIISMSELSNFDEV